MCRLASTDGITIGWTFLLYSAQTVFRTLYSSHRSDADVLYSDANIVRSHLDYQKIFWRESIIDSIFGVNGVLVGVADIEFHSGSIF